VARADVTLGKIFTDNMMFQRDQPIRVWGKAAPGEMVTVELAGDAAETQADENGGWLVELPPRAAGVDLRLVVTAANKILLKNIVMGDVWLCSGQSNMEWSLVSCDGAEDAKAAALPLIRRVKFGHCGAATGAEEVPVVGAWQVCSPKTAGGFTAAGFYFAREIHAKTGVPIGLIDDNWGGTPIESWIAPEGIDAVPEAAQSSNENVKRHQAVDASPAQKKRTWSNISNGMIHPIVRFPIKGAIWYQGESNGREGESYFFKMQALLAGWRKLWKQPDMPVYFVQLASHKDPSDAPAGGDGFANIREAQRHALRIPRTGMAVAIDTVPLAAAADVHPKNKYDVGTRLARWALHRDYGQTDLVPSGPQYRGLKVEGAKIRLEFDHVGSGLMVGLKDGTRKPVVEDVGGSLKRFAVAGADKEWFWADAVIDGETVLVSSAAVKEPVAVRYAFSGNPHGANLYNREGLPASPFRTDDW
ncbi:MAG: sialate O-acetylesterase, partial [Planctomycetia bacterium]